MSTTMTAPAKTRVQRLAAALLADRQRDISSDDDAAPCFICGRAMLYRGSRFCSDGCRAYYDIGAPGVAQDWRQPKPDYGGLRSTRHGFTIRCAHCGQEFESHGLRCCSPKCEAEMRKPRRIRKRRRPKIRYYTVKVNGHGYWQPGQAIRDLGFQSADCGFDGPDAWAKAERLNAAVRKARSGDRTGR